MRRFAFLLLLIAGCTPASSPSPGNVDGGTDVLQCGAGCAHVQTTCDKTDAWKATCVESCTESWTSLRVDMHPERWDTRDAIRDAGWDCP